MPAPVVSLELTLDDARRLAMAAHVFAIDEPRLAAVAAYVDLAVLVADRAYELGMNVLGTGAVR